MSAGRAFIGPGDGPSQDAGRLFVTNRATLLARFESHRPSVRSLRRLVRVETGEISVP